MIEPSNLTLEHLILRPTEDVSRLGSVQALDVVRLTAAVLLLLSSSASLASALGVETTNSCTASDKGVAHELKVVERDGAVAWLSYSSVNQKNGDDCAIEVGNETQDNAPASQWSYWGENILVRIKVDPRGSPAEGDQSLFVLKEPRGYRIFVSPDAARNACGLHGYLANSVSITAGSPRCKLKW